MKSGAANSNLSYATHALNLIKAYLGGLIAGNLIMAPYFERMAVIFIVGGMIMAAPLLLVILAAVPFIRASLEKNTRAWCIFATLIMPVFWLVLEYATNYSKRGWDISGYLSIKNVWERAALALLCAGLSAGLYYLQTKRALNKK